MSIVGFWRRWAGLEEQTEANPFGFVREMKYDQPLEAGPIRVAEKVVEGLRRRAGVHGIAFDYTPRATLGHRLKDGLLMFDTFCEVIEQNPVFAANMCVCANMIVQAADRFRMYIGTPRAVDEPLNYRRFVQSVLPFFHASTKRIEFYMDAEGDKSSPQGCWTYREGHSYQMMVNAEPGPGINSIWSFDPEASCLVLYDKLKSIVTGNPPFAPAHNHDKNAKCKIRVAIDNIPQINVPELVRWYQKGVIHAVDFPWETPDETIALFLKGARWHDTGGGTVPPSTGTVPGPGGVIASKTVA